MSFRPLVIVTTYNRREYTEACLAALEETTDLERVELAIVDNGSWDGSVPVIEAWARGKPVTAYFMNENLGIPRALNYAIHRLRKPGQAVIKLDNDGKLLTPGWVDLVAGFLETWRSRGEYVALLCAYYSNYDMFKRKQMMGKDLYKGHVVYRHYPAGGICTLHTGPFMDQVGYFDVLSPHHKYGFEDLIMAVKAHVMNFGIYTWEGWRLENIQRRGSAYGAGEGEDKKAHVAEMRPLYQARMVRLADGRTVYTGPLGKPGR